MDKKILTSVMITENPKTRKLTFTIDLTDENKQLFLVEKGIIPKKIIKNIIIN